MSSKPSIEENERIRLTFDFVIDLDQSGIPVSAGVIEVGKIAPIALRQVTCRDMSMEGSHFAPVEEHTFLQLLPDEGLEHLPDHVEQERLLHDVDLK